MVELHAARGKLDANAWNKVHNTSTVFFVPPNTESVVANYLHIIVHDSQRSFQHLLYFLDESSRILDRLLHSLFPREDGD